MTFALALVLTLISAVALNAGYLIEHSAVGGLPRLSIRRPLHSARLLLWQRRWLGGFALEMVGWGLFVAALAMAPLAIVQATAAGGIALLAVMAARFTKVALTDRERLGVALSVGGLVLLGISLLGGHEEGPQPAPWVVALWLGGSALAAVLAAKVLGPFIGLGVAFGLATGILFAAGDVSTKMAVEGGPVGPAFYVGIVVFYALGTGVLQAAFQHSAALTTAGIATLVTNALPIVAGMTIFGEPLPGGWIGAVRITSFAAVIAGAVALAGRKHGSTQRRHGRVRERGVTRGAQENGGPG